MGSLRLHSPNRRHVLTIGLEDYFQVGAFNRIIQRGQWHRFDTRLELNTRRVLDLLDESEATATFFVLGWIAERFPELLREVAERGHEVASKGFYHRGVEQMTRDEFREDSQRSKAAIENATGKQVLGYRLAQGWFRPHDLWALDVLAELGFAYDSSLADIGRTYAHEPWRRALHRLDLPGGQLWELPISSTSVCGMQVPFAGGNYFRQLPKFFTSSAIRGWDERRDEPMVFYFHTWEIDAEQPRLNTPSMLARLRHYRNLYGMYDRLRALFETYRFGSAVDVLDLHQRRVRTADATPAAPAPTTISAECPRPGVSIVVPCYNEEITLPYLANTLAGLSDNLGADYRLEFVLVDDGSSDGTWEGMKRLFDGRSDVKLARHDTNCGVAAAIRTGIRAASNETVCSIDADCTYDPAELRNMIPLLADDVALVTASPYHPLGGVRHVPNWRLGLSRGASWLYRRTLRQKLFTYTSCFRVYRRSFVDALPVQESGFLGVAELLGRVDLAGGKIVEHPAVLEARLLGRSKMKTLNTVLGHLRLLAKLRWLRMRGAATAPPALQAKDDAAPAAQSASVSAS